MKAMNMTVESFDDNIDTYIESKDENPQKRAKYSYTEELDDNSD